MVEEVEATHARLWVTDKQDVMSHTMEYNSALKEERNPVTCYKRG